MTSKENEKELYDMEADIYFTEDFGNYLKNNNIDATKFLDKIDPYIIELSVKGYIRVLPHTERGFLLIPTLPENIDENEEINEASDYKIWMEKVEKVIREITSYIQ
jgi:hypothetical protein